ncbi:hypothetical protein ACT7DG_15265 [Bacillus cereus]
MRISDQTHLQATINDMLQFEDRLHQLSLKIYPSESLRDFVNGELLPILQNLREILLLEIKQLNEGNKQVVSTEVKAVINFWWNEHLQFLASKISSADLKSSPFELMEVFKNMISKIDNHEFEIITSPINVLNFTFQEIWQPIKMVLENEIGISRYTNKKIIDLTFPNQHKDNIFLSGIFAHEIGHYFDRNKNIWSGVFTKIVQENHYIQDLKPFFHKPDGTPVTDAEVLTLLNQQILGSWIQEAVADCVAVHLLGPAFIFSSQELLISIIGRLYVQTRHLLDMPSPTHPRSGLRLDFQINTLKSLNLYDSLPSEVKTLLDTINNDWEQGTAYYTENILNANTSNFFIKSTLIFDN